MNRPPSPEATDEAGFVAALRRLRAWSGLSYRQLEREATTAGDSLPYSTAATMLGRNRMPRPELLATFVRACGLGEDEVAEWVAARAAIASGGTPAPARRRFAGRWRMAAAAAALVAAFAGGAVLAGGLDAEVTEEIVVAP